MNKLLLIPALCLGTIVHGQTRAVTDQGKEVVLYDNGKWVYVSDSTNPASADSIKTNPAIFTKPADASFLVKSKRLNIGVHINPKKWRFSTGEKVSASAEYMFTMSSGEGYAMLITEKAAFDLESLRMAALINAKKASPDVKELFSEYRKVNGLPVLYMEMQGTVSGIKFHYAGYYYSNSKGTVQLTSFTTQSEFPNIKSNLTEILNGLVEVKQ